MDEFLDRDLSKATEDNLRWAIADKVITRILETCPLAYLEKVLLNYFNKFKEILSESMDCSS